VVGKTRTGKTTWARSLGPHNYCDTYFNASNIDTRCAYTVFDDIPFEKLIAAKGWIGCQHTITFTDKFKPKITITWGKPSIFLLNPEADYRLFCDYGMKQFIESNAVIFDDVNHSFFT
jgi:hypothetical protein